MKIRLMVAALLFNLFLFLNLNSISIKNEDPKGQIQVQFTIPFGADIGCQISANKTEDCDLESTIRPSSRIKIYRNGNLLKDKTYLFLNSYKLKWDGHSIYLLLDTRTSPNQPQRCEWIKLEENQGYTPC